MMQSYRSLLVAIVIVGLGGCTYQATAPVAPAFDVFASYTDRVQGKFEVVIDPQNLDGSYKVKSYYCSAHTYPLDARAAFGPSMLRTIEQIVQEVVAADQPTPPDSIAAKGFRGVIRIQGQSLDLDLNLTPGFWSSDIHATVEMAASVTVDGPEGRLMGGTISASGRSSVNTATCAGGAEVAADAAQKALRNLARQIGERIANAPRLRSPMTTPAS